jgi:hypothetical protein
MPATDTQGMAGRTRSTARGSSARTTRPPTTGTRTISTIDRAMDAASTGRYWPASHPVSRGVMTGARRVDMEVIVTDRATSPRAR